MAVKKLSGDTTKTPKTFEMVEVSLPTTKSKAATNIEDFAYYIYGAPGIGKTTFTAQFPNALHFMFEPGADDKELYQVFPKNWREVLAYVSEVEKAGKQGPFKNFIFDVVDLAWDMVEQYVCQRRVVDFLKDIGFGDGYKEAAKELRNVLIRLKRCGGLILLSHEKSQKMEKVAGGFNQYDFTHPSCSNSCNDVAKKWVSLVGNYYVNDSGERFLKIGVTKDVEAKCRIHDTHFHYSNGEKISDIPMGESAEESYNNFSKAFENSLTKPGSSAPKTVKKSFKVNKGGSK